MSNPASPIVNPNYASSGNPDPVGYAVEVTPADTDLVKGVTRGIYVGVEGDLVVMMAGDDAVITFTNVAAGIIYPIRAKQIMAATTAEGIVACF